MKVHPRACGVASVSRPPRSSARGVHPRARGAAHPRHYPHGPRQGSSPRARGSRPVLPDVTRGSGFIPARAGQPVRRRRVWGPGMRFISAPAGTPPGSLPSACRVLSSAHAASILLPWRGRLCYGGSLLLVVTACGGIPESRYVASFPTVHYGCTSPPAPCAGVTTPAQRRRGRPAATSLICPHGCTLRPGPLSRAPGSAPRLHGP